MKLLRLLMLFALSVPSTSSSESAVDYYSAVGEDCISTEDPGACMEAYGFQCSKSRQPNWSVDAYTLGCNAVRSNGRYHFVQILYENGGWNVEVQNTYVPELAENYDAVQDSSSELSAYLRNQMKDYSMQSGGTVSAKFIDGSIHFETGTRRHGEHLVVRGVCGVVVNGQLDEAISTATMSGCEQTLLRTIMMLSQPQAASPYYAAGATNIEWQSRPTSLATGDIALVVEGRQTLPIGHMPCRWISDCCSSDGSIYLDSCREPDDSEMQVVRFCLAEGLQLRTDEYVECLRDDGVKVGCDEQADGSRICY